MEEVSSDQASVRWSRTTFTFLSVGGAVKLSIKVVAGVAVGGAGVPVRAERSAPSTSCAQWIFIGGSAPSGAERLALEHVQRFLHGLPSDQFGGHAGYGDGRLAAEGLERGAVDHLVAVLLLELHPHLQHVAAIGAAHGPDRIGVFHLADVLRVGDGVGDFLLKVVVG